MSDGGTPFETARSRTSSTADDRDDHPHGRLSEHEDSREHEDIEMDRLSAYSDDLLVPGGENRELTITFSPTTIEPRPDEESSDEEETVKKPPPYPAHSSTVQPGQPDFIRVVLEFLINEGYKEAAEALCLDTGIELPKEEADYLDARVTIREAIEKGRIEEAIAKINELCPRLLAENPTVHFLLMQQTLIEMIRNGETERALEYAQTNIAGKDTNIPPNQLDQLEKTFALLAFENPQSSPFGHLLEQSHRQQVSNTVNAAVLGALHKPSRPKIEVLFKMLVFAQQQMMGVNFPHEPLPDAARVAIELFQDKSPNSSQQSASIS